VNDEIVIRLEKRLGRLHARLRLGLEADHEAQVFGQGINYFHPENLRWSHTVIQACLIAAGMYWRGQRNAEKLQVRENIVQSKRLPRSFSGFRILQLSDLHVDISGKAMARLQTILPDLEYDVCILTGDYRGQTYGPFQQAIDGLLQICRTIKKPILSVLGNHDTVRMVPDLEDMGIRMLLNEHTKIERGTDRLYFAGIDDAHFYRADNIEKAASELLPSDFAILLSHTPEVYQQAVYAGFDLLLSGHTHGGQICLPGRIPLTLDSVLPRYMGAGAWSYREMLGYTSTGAGTSVVPVRFNCPPEITIHVLQEAS
jgi:predicted MPP superfamily phosphohydrolase